MSKVGVYAVRERREVVVGCSVAAVAALIALTVCFYRRRRSRRPAVSDPEQGDTGPPSERGRLAAVMAPPPVPDLCPYSPQMDELTFVGQSPSEQYAANCRAMRTTGTGTGSRAFDVGGTGGKRCALDGPGGPPFDGGRTGRPPNSVTEPSRWNDLETMTVDVVEEDFNNDDDNDDEEEDDREEKAEEKEEEDVEMMDVNEMNNNFSNLSNTNGNNNVDDDESEHDAITTAEGLLSASTISTGSR